MSEVKETMEDFASELEASYKEYDARRNNAYQDQEGPDAEKWAELAQQMEDKTVLKVKVKEAVKGGLVAYVDDIQGFIPASQAADHYIEKLEDLVGQHLEVVPITVDMEKRDWFCLQEQSFRRRRQQSAQRSLLPLRLALL